MCSTLLVRVDYFDIIFFFFKQKTAYEMRISDWSSDVCSSDLFVGEGMVGRVGLVVAAEQLGKLARAPGIVLALALHHVAVGLAGLREIGRASCRERVCQYV